MRSDFCPQALTKLGILALILATPSPGTNYYLTLVNTNGTLFWQVTNTWAPSGSFATGYTNFADNPSPALSFTVPAGGKWLDLLWTNSPANSSVSMQFWFSLYKVQ